MNCIEQKCNALENCKIWLHNVPITLAEYNLKIKTEIMKF
jgi:hypothetical protein